METLCENNKRYRNQMLAWAIIYCSVTYASVYTLKNFGIEHFGLRALIALENGKYDPSLKLAFAIAKVFDRLIEDIFSVEQ